MPALGSESCRRVIHEPITSNLFMVMAMSCEVVCLITREQLEPLDQSTLQGQKECPDLIFLVHERQRPSCFLCVSDQYLFDAPWII